MKALYGIVEAAKLWFDVLRAYLMSVGFKRSELDNCYFVKHQRHGKMHFDYDGEGHVDIPMIPFTQKLVENYEAIDWIKEIRFIYHYR